MHEQGLVSVLKQIHDDLDAAVFDAYGWPHDLSDDEILRRLVELNRERAEEEKRGLIRWLRPEYQNPDGHPGGIRDSGRLPIEPESPEASPAVEGAKRPWPKTLPEQAQAVRAVLAEQPTGLTPEQLARLFLRANTQRVTDMLNTLVSLGQARTLEGDRYVPYLIRSTRTLSGQGGPVFRRIFQNRQIKVSGCYRRCRNHWRTEGTFLIVAARRLLCKKPVCLYRAIYQSN